MKFFLLSALLFCLHVSGLSFLYNLFRNKELIVLAYHHVANGKGGSLPEKGIPEGATIEEERFKEEMRILSRRKVISLEAYLADQGRETSLKENAYLLTFDDGYQSFYTTVYPILKQYHLPATLFLVTNAIEGKKVGWDPAIEGLSPEEQKSLFLRWEQIREMEQEGIRFGSHSRSHADLTALAEGELLEELEGSWKDLKGHLSHPLPAFCYPFGLFDEAVEKAAKRAGYRAAFSLEIKQNSDFHFRLGRLEVKPGEPSFTFISKVNGTYSLVKNLSRGMRGILKNRDR